MEPKQVIKIIQENNPSIKTRISTDEGLTQKILHTRGIRHTTRGSLKFYITESYNGQTDKLAYRI